MIDITSFDITTIHRTVDCIRHSFADMATHGNDDCRQSTVDLIASVDSQAPTPQMYPRTHLLGIPQELQDLIFDEVFDAGVNITGAAKLKPLLTCRHIYNIANVKAWKNSRFVVKGLTEDRVTELKSSIPASIRARKILGMTIRRSQMIWFAQLSKHLPHPKAILVPRRTTTLLVKACLTRTTTRAIAGTRPS